MRDMARLSGLFTTVVVLATLWGSSLQAMSDEEIAAVRDGRRQRCDQYFRSQKGKPFKPRKIRVDWNDRGDFTRHYGQSVALFAHRAFYLGEQLDEANEALRGLCRYHLDRPETLYEIHSFHWFTDDLLRLYKLYGPEGRSRAGLLERQTVDILLETAWRWAAHKSHLAEAELEQSQTWHLRHSENHHAQHVFTCWAFSMLLKDHAEYGQRPFEDGRRAGEHFTAWEAYVSEYLRQRGAKGMLVEIASPSYAAATLRGIYAYHDFSENALLRHRARCFLDLYWALWAQEQLDAVRGGGKTRCYPKSAVRGNDFIRRAVWYYLGIGDPAYDGAHMLPFVCSSWRMPDVVIDMALDGPGRGCYEIRQRRMGLAEPGYDTHQAYRLQKEGGILRYSYCTPEFIAGTLMTAARDADKWTAISSQNRWAGVIFAGACDGRLFAACQARKGVTYNQHWHVQCKSALISQKLRGSSKAGAWGVWFSQDGLSEPQDEDGWVFVEAAGAYAAVKCVAGGYQWESVEARPRGRWLRCRDEWTPVIIQLGRKEAYANMAAFQTAVKTASLTFRQQRLDYTSLDGHRLTLCADQSEPLRIDGVAVNYTPNLAYDSPFVQGRWEKPYVVIKKDAREHILDFDNVRH